MKSRAELEKILRRAIAPVERKSVAEWAEEYGRLPSSSAEPGRYRADRTPYFKPVMDSFTEPDIKRIVVKSAAQTGKSVSTTTPIATPDGFKLMRDIEVGDKVFDERGEICNVTGVSPIQYNRPCYEITFSDGARIVADGEHLWQIGDAILTTTQLEVGMSLPDVILTETLALAIRLRAVDEQDANPPWQIESETQKDNNNEDDNINPASGEPPGELHSG